MKKLLSVFSIFILAFLFLLSRVSSAKVIYTEKGVTEVTKDEVVNDDLFVAGETVVIEGTVNGDVYAGAETVRVTGVINGDLHAGAGMVYISGRVSDDVYIGAGNVSLNKAKIGGSFVTGAGNVNIDENSSIAGSLIAGTGNLTVYAPIAKNVMIGAGSVDLNSGIGGEVRIGAGEISLGPDTKIGKDFYYAIGDENKEISIPDTATVAGKIQRYTPEFSRNYNFEESREAARKTFKTVKLVAAVFSLIGAFLVGYLWFKFLPKSLLGPADVLTKSFPKSLGVGFLVSVLALPLFLMLCITGVGIPLAGVLLLIFLLSLYLSKIVVSVSLGNKLYEKLNWKKGSIPGIMAAGLISVYLLKAIPFIGFIITLAVLWSGIGALVLYFKSAMPSSK